MGGNSQGLFIVLSGPSGAGKDSILDGLEKRGVEFHRVTTCTTRPPRAGERNGVDYFFLTDHEFDELIRMDGLLEHAVVYGHRSGVPKQQVLDALAAGNDVIVRTDVQGAATIKANMPDAILIFVAPSSLLDIEERIRARRSDDEERIQRRLETARSEMFRQADFDHVVLNVPNRLDETIDHTLSVIHQERRRRLDADEP